LKVNFEDGPFIVIKMPYDKDGFGPALKENTVIIDYEIWDCNLNAVAAFPTREEAIKECDHLNDLYGA